MASPATVIEYGQYIDLQNYFGCAADASGFI